MNKFEWEDHATKQPFNGDALRVLWRYQHHADSESLITYPGIRQIASDTNISVERVGRYRRELIEAGWLVKTDQKTPSGEAKLRLAVGEDINNDTYLGQAGKKMNKKSKANLVPAAKQKKDERVKQMIGRNIESNASLEYPDSACLENGETPCLENGENEVSNIQTEQSRTTITRTTNNNHEPSASASVANAPSAPNDLLTVREEPRSKETTHTCLTDGTSLNPLGTAASGGTEYGPSLNFNEMTSNGFTYLLSNEGVDRVLNDEEPSAATDTQWFKDMNPLQRHRYMKENATPEEFKAWVLADLEGVSK